MYDIIMNNSGKSVNRILWKFYSDEISAVEKVANLRDEQHQSAMQTGTDTDAATSRRREHWVRHHLRADDCLKLVC